MDFKKISTCIYIKNGNAVKSIKDMTPLEEDPVSLAASYSNYGADEIIIFDFSSNDDEHAITLNKIKEISRVVDIPIIGAGNVKRLEDVKKLLYAGCQGAVLNYSHQGNVKLTEEVSKRFGRDKIYACIDSVKQLSENDVLIRNFVKGVILIEEEEIDGCLEYMHSSGMAAEKETVTLMPILFTEELHHLAAVLRKHTEVAGVAGGILNTHPEDIMKLKGQCKGIGISVDQFEASMKWEDFKLNSDNMLPVVVQDYKTSEVLMVAYMNKEAYEKTIETGVMTYFSRSRNELWIKGATSGHYQYVKALYADCDSDTLLAKVNQVGAACHTGNRSCFFNEVLKKSYDATNPLMVFEKEYATIIDRKLHPKEGSYTNYLFDKGIDKILKKVGEECTEIIIAAKNPDPEEIKYEIADFLYHCMVLMAEKDVTWDDITKEIAQR